MMKAVELRYIDDQDLKKLKFVDTRLTEQQSYYIICADIINIIGDIIKLKFFIIYSTSGDIAHVQE